VRARSPPSDAAEQPFHVNPHLVGIGLVRGNKAANFGDGELPVFGAPSCS
jgi:hypothetical protein